MSMDNKKTRHERSQLMPLFLTFFKIGSFTFGGGYAMLPLIQREAAAKHKWINDDEIMEIAAIAESTPGPIAVNTATFVGYRICGTAGALIATLGVVLPSFIVIIAVSSVLQIFSEARVVKYAFYGIRAGVLALIVRALYGMFRQCPGHVVSYILMGIAFAAAVFTDTSVLLVLALCALVGLLTSMRRERNRK